MAAPPPRPRAARRLAADPARTQWGHVALTAVTLALAAGEGGTLTWLLASGLDGISPFLGSPAWWVASDVITGTLLCVIWASAGARARDDADWAAAWAAERAARLAAEHREACYRDELAAQFGQPTAENRLRPPRVACQ